MTDDTTTTADPGRAPQGDATPGGSVPGVEDLPAPRAAQADPLPHLDAPGDLPRDDVPPMGTTAPPDAPAIATTADPDGPDERAPDEADGTDLAGSPGPGDAPPLG
jgi:hypothetical protein